MSALLRLGHDSCPYVAIMTTSSSDFDQDRRPALYGSLITFLVFNNLIVAARILAHYRAFYRKGGRIFLEDIFILLSGVRDQPQKNKSKPND